MEQPPGSIEHPEGRLHHLVHRLAEDDPSRKLSRRTRLLMTLGPIAAFGLILLVTGLRCGWKAAGFLWLAAVASFVGGGKFAVLMGAAKGAPLGVWPLAHIVIFGDIATMFIMMGNMHLLYRAPWVGRKLAQAHEASHYVLKANPWMRRLAWIGLAVFVAVPFQGTGAVGGTILARILGMSYFSIVTAIPIGSFLGCYPLALLGMYGRDSGFQHVANHPLAAVLFFVLLIAVIYILGRKFTGASLRKQEEAAAAKGLDGAP